MDYTQDLSAIADLLKCVIFALGFIGGMLFISFLRGRWL